MRIEHLLSKLAGIEAVHILRTLLTQHFPPHVPGDSGRERLAGFIVNVETRDFFFSEN